MIGNRATLMNDQMLLGKLVRNNPAIIDAGVRVFASTMIASLLTIYNAATIRECEDEIARRLSEHP